jgi:hypothetical protein
MILKLLLKEKKPDPNLLKLSFWCTAIVNGADMRIRVRHTGRGKFQVLESELDMGVRIVDASDIVHCDI